MKDFVVKNFCIKNLVGKFFCIIPIPVKRTMPETQMNELEDF